MDYIVIDSPPVGMFADGDVLADVADSALLVVRQDVVSACVSMMPPTPSAREKRRFWAVFSTICRQVSDLAGLPPMAMAATATAMATVQKNRAAGRKAGAAEEVAACKSIPMSTIRIKKWTWS